MFNRFQAIFRKLKSLNLRDYVKNNVRANIFIKQVLCLAFLPPEIIPEKFQELCRLLPERVNARLRFFNRYFRRQWIGGVTLKGFSVYGLSKRTNNCVESFNSHLNHKMKRHPTG